jgi:hypothetical protein
MMSFCRSVFFVLLLLMAYSCKKQDKPTPYKPRFVVEGCIEKDDYPYVIVTHNLPFFYSDRLCTTGRSGDSLR